MMLVGKLIWYKDYILRNQEKEKIEQKLQELEKYLGIRE
jgi:hypothetical protein